MREPALRKVELAVPWTGDLSLPEEAPAEVQAAEEEVIEEAPASIDPATRRKPWMDYRAVTDETSPQYALLAEAEPDENGVMRWRGHVCVALGQRWGNIGDTFTFTIGGKETPCVMADAKMGCHTAGGAGWAGEDGHVLEIIVDSDKLQRDALLMGDCDYIPELEGEVE